MHDLEKILACPVCKSKLKYNTSSFLCPRCQSEYPIVDGIPILLPSKLSKFKKMEANHHSKLARDYDSRHQLNTFRSTVFADQLVSGLRYLPEDSLIIEIGCGTGFHGIKLMKKGYNSILLTEISLGMIKQAQENVEKEKLSSRCRLMVLDAEELPFLSNSIDGIYMNAVLHHLPSPIDCLKEIKRCLKSQGLVCLVSEPNRWIYCAIRSLYFIGKTPHSIGDVATRGFNEKQIRTMFKEAGLRIVNMKTFWFISGFVDSGMRVLFELLHLKQRFKIPLFLDKSILLIEKSLDKIPLINTIGWRWTCVGKKMP